MSGRCETLRWVLLLFICITEMTKTGEECFFFNAVSIKLKTANFVTYLSGSVGMKNGLPP